MLSVKSQIQANHEQIKANESKFELNQSLLADQLKVAQETISGSLVRLGDAEMQIHENSQKIISREDEIKQDMESISG